MSFHVPEKYRIQTGPMGSTSDIGNAGAFDLRLPRFQRLFAIASDAAGWEHVSVSRYDRCPTWEEMCQVKAIFWDEEDCVVQYHPAKSEYVNRHPNCLHLWRAVGEDFPIPPSTFVG